MQHIPDTLAIAGLPPHVASWCVAKIPGFVPAILRRWLRAQTQLPESFCLVMCPVAEVNAHGGIPARVHELTDPRLTCRHFTGCSRPYYAMIFSGVDADSRRAQVQSVLPWSESYSVRIDAHCVHMDLIEAVEDIEGLPRRAAAVPLATWMEDGGLLKIL